MRHPALKRLIALATVLLLAASTSAWGVQEKSDPNSDGPTGAATDSAAGEPGGNQEPSPPDDLAEVLAGHSYHGDAFNEGPRQKAYLMGGTGNVNFPVTCKSDEVQAFINQGIGQIHGFWDLEAERSFRQAAALDPNCAMAYWGAARATIRNVKRARGFIEKAVELKESVSSREQKYIDALNKYLQEKPDKKKRAENLLKDLESIVLEFPDDLEAKAFVALRVWLNAREGIPVASYLSTNALLDDIFEVEPLHPAHHFAIHLWDYRKPEMALKSAARGGPSAPGIAHMWHMPGHTYSRLKRYEDAVYQQEASARVDHAHMMRDRVLPDEIHNFAHNNEWLIRNLVFIGRVDDAVDLARNMTELPQHPKYNTLAKRGGSASYGRRRLLQVLREYQLWEQAVALCQSPHLHLPDNEEEQIKTLRLLGSAAAMLEQVELTASTLAQLNETWQTNRMELQTKEARNRLLEATGISSNAGDLAPIPRVKLKPAEIKKEIAENKKAISGFKRIAGAAEKAIQAIEGYRFAAAGSYADAHTRLTKASGEDLSWLAELQFLSGKQEEGLQAVQKQIERRPKEVIPLARLAFLQHQAGKLEDAQQTLATLRETSGSIDLHVPLFSRLEPIATASGLEGNWLRPIGRKADTGFRPPLDSLGPFRWSPSPAPEWKLVGTEQKTLSSLDFHGKPHVLIFYLGHGCLHCAEQLEAFGPELSKFKEAGIEFVAISTDRQEDLSKSIENYNGIMPFGNLVSDHSLEVFKKFRAYDDFESQPLHGTFLIDSHGRVRWQDISYEPFMDHQFLFREAQRLLKQESSDDSLAHKQP